MVASQHSSLQILHEPPSLPPFLYSPPACLSVNSSNTITQLRKREKEALGGGGGDFYNGTLVFITLNGGG